MKQPLEGERHQGEATRRDFLKGIAALGAGIVGPASLAACSPTGNDASKIPATGADGAWDEEADVVIVGGGGTGWAAAWAAADAGSSVIVFEKSEMSGGNTGLSGGMMLAAGTETQKEKGIEDDAEKFAEEQLAYGMGCVDEDLVRKICSRSAEMISWMEGFGQIYDVLDPIPSLKPYSNESNWAKRCHWHYDALNPESYQESYGGTHVARIREAAEKMGVRCEMKAEVTHLITDDERGVIGVTVKMKDDEIRVKSKKGVVLAAAGIDNDPELARGLNKQQLWGLQCVDLGQGSNNSMPSNTGDGIRMGMEIGAALNLSPACVMQPPVGLGGVHDYPALYYGKENPQLYGGTANAGIIAVNRYGRRFMQEDAMWTYICGMVFEEAVNTGCVPPKEGEHCAWQICDADHVFQTLYSFGGDEEEAVSSGLLVRADSIEGLAEAIGIDPEPLKDTVDRWNDLSTRGEDPDFGRKADFGAIAKAPFYAASLDRPIVMGTAGGLKVNADCEVVDIHGEVIPHLFAGGMNAGGWIGKFYHACGWAVTGTAVTGRTCGENAAKQEAWS